MNKVLYHFVGLISAILNLISMPFNFAVEKLEILEDKLK
jgi:hypothetical protein